MAKNRSVLGIDLSKDGVDYAARRAKLNDTGAGFAVASVFEMPIKDAALDAVVNIFAPCAEAEYSRVLRNGGNLLVVSAGEQHLMGLKRVLCENPYLNQGRADLPKTMTLVQKYRLKDEIYLEDPLLIEALFSMTPYYWRTSQEDHQKLKNAERLITEIDFDIFLFRKDS
jgi:23S rRNA (guanine745-N1)-methyltransferase